MNDDPVPQAFQVYVKQQKNKPVAVAEGSGGSGSGAGAGGGAAASSASLDRPGLIDGAKVLVRALVIAGLRTPVEAKALVALVEEVLPTPLPTHVVLKDVETMLTNYLGVGNWTGEKKGEFKEAYLKETLTFLFDPDFLV